MTLTIGVLGTLEVRRDGQRIELTAGRLRSLLTVLAMSAGRAVAVDDLIAGMWDEGELPNNARRVVQIYVTRLRAAVGAEYVGRAHGGYLLDIEPEDVDALRFLRLLDAAWSEPDPAAQRAHLEQALALWRGTPFDDVPSPSLTVSESPRLVERYLAGLERRMDLDVAAGRHDDLVAELAALTARHPLRESLWVRRLKVLRRAGRPAEALSCYEEVRTHLVEELGVDPGSELRQLYADLLAGRVDEDTPGPTAPSVPVPRQLPPDTGSFTGRVGLLADLDAMLPGGSAGDWTAARIAVLNGLPGVGKTAAAVHWAHRCADRFPDGQLFLNLRGYSTTPAVRPVEALGVLLRGLGVPADQIPLDVDEQAALYRSRLVGRQVLVLLDNAANAEQVRPLLVSEPRCLILITSRGQLPGLVALQGARILPVGVLEPGESRALLTELFGAARPSGVPDPLAGLAQLAELCGHLPLALRIAGTHLTTRPSLGVDRYAARLRTGDRLATLSIDDDPQATVRATFDLSYQALAERLRRLFRLLALHPGVDFAADTAAALAGTSDDEAERLLNHLAEVSLLERAGAGRYAWHDLLRLYAERVSAAEDPPEERAAATTRLFDFYLATTGAAMRLAFPSFRFRAGGGAAGAAPRAFTDAADALCWLDGERANLVAVVERTADQGPPAVAWQLAGLLYPYLVYGDHVLDWRRVAQRGLSAASRAGNEAEMAAMLHSLGTWYGSRGEVEPAVEHLERALALRRGGDPAAEANTRTNLGIVLGMASRFEEARTHLREAHALAERVGDSWLLVSALNSLGMVCRHMGRLTEALDVLTETLALERAAADRRAEAATLENLATVYADLGRFAEAVELLDRCFEIVRELNDRINTSLTMISSALVHASIGRVGDATRLAEQALGLARETGQLTAEVGALSALATCHRIAGRLDLAEADGRRALSRAQEIRNVEGEAEALTGLADTLLRAGRPEAACASAERAAQLADDHGLRVLHGRALTVLAAGRLDRGEYGDAQRDCEHALALHREVGHRPGEARALDLLGRILGARDESAAGAAHRRVAEQLFAEMGMIGSGR
jgi:DNA-binding SARP family transcriptional activator/tetratricopeptide (TPR) repeat protein